MAKIWKWWLVVNLAGWSLGLAQYYLNVIGFIASHDTTYISFVIMGILLFTSILVGVHIYNNSHGEENMLLWFLSDAVLSLGMVGTLFGFLMVLGSSFADIDPSSLDSMTKAISVLAAGMSTALLTSLVGLVSSLLLKLQLVIMEG